MKFKLVLIALLFTKICHGQQQLDKGAKILGGSIGINNSSIENFDYNSTTKSLNISPYFGYFPNDNLAIGMYLIFSSSENSRTNLINSTPADWNETTQQMIGFAPFVRYYMPISAKFKFFGQLNAYNGFGKSESKFSSVNQGISGKLDIRQFGVAVLPGFAFFATKKLALEGSFNVINYNKYRFYLGDTEIQNNDNFNFTFGDLNPNIGLSYSF